MAKLRRKHDARTADHTGCGWWLVAHPLWEDSANLTLAQLRPEIGVFGDGNAATPALPASRGGSGPYRSQGSLQTAFQRAVEHSKLDRAALNSGHIVVAVPTPSTGRSCGRSSISASTRPCCVTERVCSSPTHRPRRTRTTELDGHDGLVGSCFHENERTFPLHELIP